MQSHFERVDIFARDSALPRSRIRFLAEADDSVVHQIIFGVMFVMAFWSSPSRQAFRRLTGVMADLDPEGRLEFVVVDTDGCPALYDKAEFTGHMGGAGETAWIKDGNIVCTSGRGYNPQWFEPNTIMLLSIIN